MQKGSWIPAVMALGLFVVGCSGASTAPDGSGARDATNHADGALDASDAPSTPPDAPSASDSPAEAASDVPAAVPDAPTDVRDAGATADVPLGDVGDATEAARDAPATGDGAGSGDAPGDGGSSDAVPSVGSNWAQWPMPNIASDVANGAPHPEMLVDNGDDTITDAVTGLMWQQTESVTSYTRPQAAAHCQKLGLGGHADWRVPSAIELSSIADFDHANPSIDPTPFPDTAINVLEPTSPKSYTSTTTLVGANGWMVDFAAGRTTLYSFGDDPFYLRCVRGPSAPATDTSAGRYDLATAGVALDVKTGLAWQRVPPNQRTKLVDAKAYCAAPTGLPGTGWRLPTVKELLTLVDFEKMTGFLLDQTVFSIPTNLGDTSGVFWTATAVVGKPQYSQFTSGQWTVYFNNGNNYYVDAVADYGLTRCVR
jgi:hypothetical protein